MNIGLAAATFALVVPAELPDKTFISAIVLSSRHRPFPVWIGASCGLLLQAVIAVAAGRLIGLLPHRVVEGIVAALFFCGAAYLYIVASREHEPEDSMTEHDPTPGLSNIRIVLTTFGLVTLAEFGDLTQVVIANFSARFRDALSIFVGAAIAFILVSGIGVLVGQTLTRYVPLRLVRLLSATAMLGLGIWSLVTTATG